MTATVAGIHLGPDTHANRPAAATPPVGSLYSCTDHSLVYRTDGSTWSTYASAITAAGSVATDAIWDAAGDLAVGSGADTAAKLTKGADGGMLAMGNGAVIWNAGTSFPASKATNDRYWRTDLGMGFHWDGTRWVSDQLFDLNASAGQEDFIPLSATGGTTRTGTTLGVGTDLWLENAITTFFVSGGTALGASHKWVGVIRKVDTSNSFTTLITVNIDSGANNTDRIDSQAIGALLGTAATYPFISPTWTKTGTPGTLRVSIRITCRIVTT